MQPRSALRLKFLKFFFVQALTLVRVPLIFFFLAISVFCRHPVSEFWFLVAFTAMICRPLPTCLTATSPQVSGRFPPGQLCRPMTDKVFYLTTFPTLVYLADRVGQPAHARVLLVLAILFLLRDQWISFLRSLGALHDLSARQLVGEGAHSHLVSDDLRHLLLPPGAAPLGPSGVRVHCLRAGGLEHDDQSDLDRSLHARFWPALRAELVLPAGEKPNGKDERRM